MTIDGLNVSVPTRKRMEAMARAGITAVNWTCCVWESFAETMRNIAQWKQIFEANADIVSQVYSADDIREAKRTGRLGVYLGWQNTSGLDDYLPYVRLFSELGVRVVQLTYNTANSVGCGCRESVDRGLTDFGKELIRELNGTGILIDLSHVGPVTAADAIETSSRPVCFSHALPAALFDHPRNKPDDLLQLLASHDGFVGATLYPRFLKRGDDSTLEDYIDALEHLVAVVGEDRVGVGSDYMDDRESTFFEWIRRDRGYGRPVSPLGTSDFPPAFGRAETGFDLLRAAIGSRGWPADRLARVLGENWLAFLDVAWNPASI